MFNVCRRGIFVKQDKSPNTAYNRQEQKQQRKNRILVNEAVRGEKGSPAVKQNMQEYGKINGTAPARDKS